MTTPTGTLPLISRKLLAAVFKDPRTLLAFEAIQRQVASVLPGGVNSALDVATGAAIAADDAQFDASNALALGGALQNPSYVTLAASTTLNNERILTGGTGVTLPVAGGNVTIVVDVAVAQGFTSANKAGDTFTGPVTLPSYTVAGLPVAGAGATAYASNGRKNGEGGGAGTGVMVFHDAANWIACDSGQVVAA